MKELCFTKSSCKLKKLSSKDKNLMAINGLKNHWTKKEYGQPRWNRQKCAYST